MFIEMFRTTRLIPIDDRPLGALRQDRGESRAHWEGETLVVETRNLKYGPSALVGGASRDAIIVERFRRVSADMPEYRVHGRRPGNLDDVLDGAADMAKEPDSHVRVRLPRRELRVDQHDAVRATRGSGGRETVGISFANHLFGFRRVARERRYAEDLQQGQPADPLNITDSAALAFSAAVRVRENGGAKIDHSAAG